MLYHSELHEFQVWSNARHFNLRHMKKLFYFIIVRHKGGNQFLMFHEPQSKAPCFSSFMSA